ncbi:FAD-binding domain-containing protein 24 [Elsinoe australis]|uniref:FAD-binding domain-containing protein 24 n=1 Tax=Elsinoe australis TaxID=40998 RepID=A0A4U7AWY9_9PEZI|nr:FAD-binding domain-containing protein 24 [Elsinoe australis]
MTASTNDTSGVSQIDDTIPMAGSTRTEFRFDPNFDHSSIPLQSEKWPVMIIGSSMVGMSFGVMLGYHGIKSASFDRHPSTAIHPRAALFLLKSIEIFRQLGLDEIMTKESASNFDLDAGMIIVEKLVGGKTLMSMQESDPNEVAKVSPVQRLWLTQNMFEPLLRQRAKDYGAEQFFGQTIVHYEEVEDGVIVVVQDTETKKLKKYKTNFLVASDGNRSATRAKEDIEWRGPGLLQQAISINFKANLAPYLGTRAVHGVTYINNEKISAGFRLESGGQRGFQIVTRAGNRNGFPPDSVSEKDAKQYFYDATGIEDDVNLIVESVSYWSAAAYTADSFSSKGGRVYIMGDAAHVMPPTGGMGGNTGVQDAYNLAWKMAYVLKNLAPKSLLNTYSVERHVAAKFCMTQAYSRFQKRVERKKPDVDELADIVCELGYRYPTGALAKGGARSEEHEDPYNSLLAPGSRLPHVELVDESQGGKKISSIDLFKTNFLLVATESASPWAAAAKSSRLPIDAYEVNGNSTPMRDLKGKSSEVWKLGAGEAFLVRPDGFIAWKAPGQSGQDHAEILAQKLREVLSG